MAAAVLLVAGEGARAGDDARAGDGETAFFVLAGLPTLRPRFSGAGEALDDAARLGIFQFPFSVSKRPSLSTHNKKQINVLYLPILFVSLRQNCHWQCAAWTQDLSPSIRSLATGCS